MAIDAGSVYSSVRIRLDSLDNDLQGVYARLGQLESKTKTTTTGIGKSFDAMSIVSIAAMAGIGVALKTSVGQFADFQQSMANVASVAGGTAEDFAQLEHAAAKAGETTRFTASQAADALYFLASAGLDAQQSIAALDGVLKLAGATQSDLASTAESVTATISQYGLAASEATRVSNIFAAAIGNSQATMPKLTESMKYVGAVAGAFGISLEETTGALQLLYNAGFKGEQAGTILRNVLSDLANESGIAMARLTALGVSFEDVNPATNSLAEVFNTLREANLSTADSLAVFGDRAGPGMVTLLSAGAGEIEKYTAAVTGTNAAIEMYAKQNDTLAGSYDEMTSASEGAGIALGKVFEPALRGVLGAARDTFLFLSKAPDILKALAGAVSATVVAVGAAIPVIRLLGITMQTAAGPIGWVALGLTAVITGATLASKAIKENTTRIKEMGENAGVSAKQAAELERSFNRMDIGTANIKSVANDVKILAERLGVSERAAIDVALASEKISPHYKSLLEQLRPVAASLEEQKKTVQDMASAEDLLLEKTLMRKAAESKAAGDAAAAAAKKAKDDAAKARAEEKYKKLRETVVGILEDEKTEYQKLQDQIDEIANLPWAPGEYEEDRLKAIEALRAKQQLIMDDEAKARADLYGDWLLLQKNTGVAVSNDNKDVTKKFEDNWRTAVQVAETLLTGLVDIWGSLQQTALDNQFNALQEELDAELQAELYSNGLTTAATEDQFRAELEAAQLAGDAEAITEAENALKKFQIEEEYAKKKAELDYKEKLASWELSKKIAAAQAAIAVVGALASPPFWPLNAGSVATATAAGLVQYGAVVASKPTPSFEYGGIVPGTSYSGDNIAIKANSREGVMTLDQQKRLFDIADGNGGGSSATAIIPVYFSAAGFKDLLVGTMQVAFKNGEVKVDARTLTNLSSAMKGATN